MQQTEQMARHHDVWHYALWSLIQQSEIQFARGFLQAAWETQERAFQLIKEQHLEQLPMHKVSGTYPRAIAVGVGAP